MNTEIAARAAPPMTGHAVRPLAAKAMLVKLTSSKPTTARREKAAEAIIQDRMGDTSLTVSSHIFKDKHNPVRKVLNEAGMVYSYHVSSTMAWQDRGPRMLPIDAYEKYAANMRRLIADVDGAVHALGPVYQGLVDTDIAERQATLSAKAPDAPVRDFSGEYPTFEAFKEAMKFTFMFMPMPDESHFLFDISDEDKAQLAETIQQAEKAAKDELVERLRAPLLHLVGKLKTQIGGEGAIFRDSAVENIVEQCEMVESLAMGDEVILRMVAELRIAIRPHALAPNSLRESPITRADAATKLADVAARMDFLMGGVR